MGQGWGALQKERGFTDVHTLDSLLPSKGLGLIVFLVATDSDWIDMLDQIRKWGRMKDML